MKNIGTVTMGIVLASLALTGCEEKTPDSAPPFSTPPTDCLEVQAVTKDAVSSYAGELYDPKSEFRPEQPQKESATVLTCYGAFVNNASHRDGADATGIRAATVFIAITVNQPGSWGDKDPVNETERSFISYRDQHSPAVKIVNGIGDDAYSFHEISSTDAAAETDFRVANATVHIRLNRTFAGPSTPEQGPAVERHALEVARALAGGFDRVMK
ncbi:hypothetical protein [Nocardia vulneris]|uniref:Lipoprotein n=1 Tax=Nocardia vulneris TaxID=1141657 RepID=A0ABR4ZG98_9NOCA|nr:hypothetical protein [Nocardia vulneris]KIA64330.1 hypothetical protein FG87_13780 [Nocardia vulneris]